jgi:DNA helicase-4
MRNQYIDSKLFVVGDDWQSIYRFAGADVSVMTAFEEKVGYAAKVYLDKTFRFNQQLASISSYFIQQNPAQIKKEISSISSVEYPVLQIIGHNIEGEHAALAQAFKNIDELAEGEKSSVYVLGRNKYCHPKSLKKWQDLYPNYDISFNTVHKSKGLEADYVIIPQVNAGATGFPSLITDDPVLSMVLPDDEQYLHAEERRLFYVAITRAKQMVIALTNVDRPSTFILEIKKDDWYCGRFREEGDKIQRFRCPECMGLTIRAKDGQYGTWYACANYPLCHGKLEVCKLCFVGAIINKHGKAVCSHCLHEFIPCPDPACCGRMVERSGKNGKFLGCSNFGKTKCKRTMNYKL